MSDRPNVLILFTDQQRYDTIAALGYGHMISPNLDKLAAEGTSYINAHSSCPVCMPARHDLITGVSQRLHGYFNNGKYPIRDYALPTIGRIFSENGYKTASVGKMHFYPSNMHHGFDEMHAMEEIPVADELDEYKRFLRDNGHRDVQNVHGVRPIQYLIPQKSPFEEFYHGTAWTAHRAIQWIHENKGMPFMAMVGFIQPHPPWHLPQRFQGIYAGRELPAPVLNTAPIPADDPLARAYIESDSAHEMRATQEAYYASVTMIDHYVGEIMDSLKNEGLLDNTLVIFTSDHGELLYDHGRFNKSQPYESSVRVPFVVRYPKRFKAGEKKTEFADLYDVLPTCLDVCGISYEFKNPLIGESLAMDAGSRDRTVQCASFGTEASRWVMARNGRYKYTYRYGGGVEEIYDMLADPRETNPLSREQMPAADYDALRNAALRHEENNGPPDTLENGGFKPCPPAPERAGHLKYTPGITCQMHPSYRTSGEERAKAFLREFDAALTEKAFLEKVIGIVSEVEPVKSELRDFFEQYTGRADLLDEYLKSKK